MSRNIEIKARIKSVEDLEPRVAAIADSGPTLMDQDDTFFPCPTGRLKLRELSPTQGELVFYQRPDQQGPKESFYIVARTAEPDNFRQALSLAYGQIGQVRKHRKVYMIQNTRIHLDRVEKLGDFLEFEVVLKDDDTPEKGIAFATELLKKLDVPQSALIEGAYLDLLKSNV